MKNRQGRRMFLDENGKALAGRLFYIVLDNFPDTGLRKDECLQRRLPVFRLYFSFHNF
jgi:hypothetical protein